MQYVQSEMNSLSLPAGDAIVSMKEFSVLQEFEDKIDIKDAWKAENEPGDSIPWEELKIVNFSI